MAWLHCVGDPGPGCGCLHDSSGYPRAPRSTVSDAHTHTREYESMDSLYAKGKCELHDKVALKMGATAIQQPVAMREGIVNDLLEVPPM